jgi:hypothetical protein
VKSSQGHFSDMMSAKQIRLLLKDNDNFLCVLAGKNACHLPSPSSLSLPKTLIINVQSKKGKIGHWVCLLMTISEALFFDSMGEQLYDMNIIKYLLPHYNCIFFNHTKIQHNSSVKCGLFCVTFTKFVKSKSDFKQFIEMFSKTDLKKNDCIAQKMIWK